MRRCELRPEGPRLRTPEARELLGELAPGGALDPAAAAGRTPYVEQLLRTLPVLTPETGAAWRCPPFGPGSPAGLWCSSRTCMTNRTSSSFV